jgi:hypothetical protein
MTTVPPCHAARAALLLFSILIYKIFIFVLMCEMFFCFNVYFYLINIFKPFSVFLYLDVKPLFHNFTVVGLDPVAIINNN